MAIAAFSFTLWAARYPQLVSPPPPAVGVNPTLAAALFQDAGLYLDNSDLSPVADPGVRLSLLNMIVAHLAILQNTQLVGRITNASEGSVSVGTSAAIPGGAEWFAQTQPGIAFWQATMGLRQATYVPGPQPYLGTGIVGRAAWLGYDPTGFGTYG